MASLSLSSFNISRETGFIPAKDPLISLPGKLQAWDVLIAHLSQLITSKKVRDEIEKLPLFEEKDLAECLSTEEQWWRAYAILCYLAHAYVWCNENGVVPRSLPESISVPWYTVASHLDIAPVITHSAVVLHNWQKIDSEGPLDDKNLSIMFSFTGSQDEEWFTVTTMLVELEASKAVAVIPYIYDAIEKNDCDSLVPLLYIVSEALQQMQKALSSMKLKCRPKAFYNEFRPYLNGWKGSADLPQGLLYSGVSDQPLQFAGGNAGQSTSVASLDILLCVQHTTRGSKEFIRQQRNYMPGSHRRFLEELDRKPSLREFLVKAGGSTSRDAVAAYNFCLESLIAFRSEHIRIVALYILCQMDATSPLKGTGASSVIDLLKDLRADVTTCMIPVALWTSSRTYVLTSQLA